MGTIICSNSFCRKEYHEDFKECPFCGTPKPNTVAAIHIENKKKLLITTSSLLDNYVIEQYLGIVNSNMVIGSNAFKDFFASFSDFFGGFSGKYKDAMDELYSEALNNLSDSALEKSANAIIGIQVNFSEISGKDKSMFMVSLSGTAVRVKEIPNYRILNLKRDLNAFLREGILSQEDYDKEIQKLGI